MLPVRELAGPLAQRGDLDELRAWADADGRYAAWRLAKLLRSVRDFARKEWPLRGSSPDGKG